MTGPLTPSGPGNLPRAYARGMGTLARMRLRHPIWLLLACLVAWAAAPARAIDPFGAPTEEDARRAIDKDIALTCKWDAGGPQEQALRALPVVFAPFDTDTQNECCWYCDLRGRWFHYRVRWEKTGTHFDEVGCGPFVRTQDGGWRAALTGHGASFYAIPGNRPKPKAPPP